MPARNRWMLLPLLASAAYAEETPREPDLRSRPEFRLHEAEVKPIDREKVPGQVREKGKVLQVDGETLLKIPNCCRVPCIPQWSQTILPVSA